MMAILMVLVSMAACGPNIALYPTTPTPITTLPSANSPTPSPTSGAISGRVIDAATGETIVGASVSTDPTTEAVSTNLDGNYSITNAKAGTYAIAALAMGYAEATLTITVVAGQTTTADIGLNRVPTATPVPTDIPTIGPPPTPLPRLSGSGGGVIAFVGFNTAFRIANANDSAGFALPRVSIYSFTWSPDGNRLAFAGEDGDIYVMSVDGTGMTNLTNSPATDSKPSWSPDGKWIAFVSDSDLYIIGVDGSGQQRLTTDIGISGAVQRDSTANNFLVWSPDATRIAFASGHDGPSPIYVVNIDGSGSAQPISAGEDPNWSPDGQQIAYVVSADIFVMNPDGSDETNLTNGQGRNFDPDWSPDGKRIAFSSDRRFQPGDLYSELHIMNADGSGVVRLSNYAPPGDPRNDAEPDWSPDGRQIAFVLVGWEAFCDVYVVNANGGYRRQIRGTISSLGAGSFVSQLAWRP